MPAQTQTVNGHAYRLWPAESYTVNCDYLVQLANGTPPNPPVGTLMWEGNGSTTFSYLATDYLEQTVGTFPNLLAALTGLDLRLYPNG